MIHHSENRSSQERMRFSASSLGTAKEKTKKEIKKSDIRQIPVEAVQFAEVEVLL